MKVKLAVVVRSLVMVGLLGSLLGPLPAAGSAPAEDGYPWISLGDRVTLTADYAGPAQAVQVLAAGQAAPLALAAGDLDEDGLPDLVAGYATAGGGLLALHRGSLDYLWPDGPEADARRAAGTLVGAPFLPGAGLQALPTAPDFLVIGDFDNDGHLDVVAAARGGEALILLPGDGQGGWGPVETVPLAGPVTALAGGDLNRRDGLQDLVVGVDGPDGSRLLVFEGADGALRRAPEALPLPAAVTDLAIGQLDEHYALDVALAAGDELLVVHGRDRRLSLGQAEQAAVAPAAVDRHPLGFIPIALALGDFLPEGEGGYRVEVALLAQDGVIRVWSPAGAAITTEYALPGGQLAAPAGAARPSLVRVKSSSLPSDDLAVVDPGGGQVRLVGMVEQERVPDEPGVWRSVVRPWSVVLAGGEEGEGTSPLQTGVAALLPMRLNPDALSDLVLLVAGGAAPLVVPSAPASVYVVNSTGDQSDSYLPDGMCDICNDPDADPPVPPCGLCTLRAAIQQANHTAGADRIEFNLGSGTPALKPAALPQISDAVTILGNTGGATRVELPTAGLLVQSGGSTIRSLVLGTGTLEIHGGSYIVEGCFIGTNAAGTALAGDRSGKGIYASYTNHTTIGGTTEQARNVIAGKFLAIDLEFAESSTSGVVQGNYIGTDATGTQVLGNTYGVHTAGSNHTIGGTSAAARNVIAGNAMEGVFSRGPGTLIQGNYIGTNEQGSAALSSQLHGVLLQGLVAGSAIDNTVGGTAAGAGNLISGNGIGTRITNRYATGNLVQGNYVGTDADGTAAVGNQQDGVYVDTQAAQNTIGGTVEAARNLIAGNGEDGIQAYEAIENTIQGNYIGTDVYGTTALGNGGRGINLHGDDWIVGGTESGAGNRIAHNSGDGVYVAYYADTGNRITGNSIYGNGGLGIDLSNGSSTPSVPDPNDSGDPDEKANRLQNWPQISEAKVVGTLCQFTFKVDTAPANATYPLRVEFFIAESSATNAEGKTFLGSVQYSQAEARTSVTKSFTGVAPASEGQSIVATATDAAGNTSEFSYPPVIAGKGPSLVVNSTGDGADSNPGNGTCAAADGKCTLRAAIQEANAKPGPDAITFNIPGGGMPAIQPASPLPVVVEAAVIDASTQPDSGGVELNGSAAGAGATGLEIISAGSSLIRGLAINRFKGCGIKLTGGGGNLIVGNQIGTDYLAEQSLGNGSHGVWINYSGSNTIGGVELRDGNVIADNGGSGVRIEGAGSSGTRLLHNTIGTIRDGLWLGNQGGGVYVKGVSGITIGAAGAGNVIAANIGSGITIEGAAGEGDPTLTGTVIQGNHIGIDYAESDCGLGWGNWGNGVELVSTKGSMVGGAAPGAGNVIGCNKVAGVYVKEGLSNTIRGNTIGVTSGDLWDRGNSSGMFISGRDNRVEGNVIANSRWRGVSISGRDNRVEGNIISGNEGNGVVISGKEASANVVHANLIGLMADASVCWLNDGDGIRIEDAPDSLIQDNVIGCNDYGIVIQGQAAIRSRIVGNTIGSDGQTDLGNRGYGIWVDDAGETTIGGEEPGMGNIISGNSGHGISIDGRQAAKSQVVGNIIGPNAAADACAKGYEDQNIGVTLAAPYGTITHNIIGCSLTYGIWLEGKGCEEARVGFNAIGTDRKGLHDLRNGKGILVDCLESRVQGSIHDNKIWYNPTAICDLWTRFTRVVSIRNNDIRHSTGGTGIHCDGCAAEIVGNWIADDAGGDGIKTENGGQPVAHHNKIENNVGYGLRNLDGGVTVDAEQNWWGHASGPGAPGGTGSGDEVSGGVDYDPWLTTPVSLTIVPEKAVVLAARGGAAANWGYVQNWETLTDTVNVSVSDTRGWLTAPLKYPVALEDEMGASFPVSFTVPAGTAVGTVDTVTINGVSAAKPTTTASATFQIEAALLADLALEKHGPDPMPIGRPASYVLTVVNGGPDAASGVTVTDTLPVELSYLGATATQGSCLELGGMVTCTLGALAVGAAATVTIEVSPTVPAVITNTARVWATEHDLVWYNDWDAFSHSVGWVVYLPLVMRQW